MTRTAKNVTPRALAHDRHVARNGRTNDMKKDGYKGWGQLDGSARHAHHLNETDLAFPPAIFDGDEDDDGYEDVDDDDEDEDEEEKEDRRQDSKVDMSWLRVLDLTLSLHAKVAHEEERREALSVRKDFGKTKKGAVPVTLTDIARTSGAVSTLTGSSFSSSPENASSLSASYHSHSDASSFSGRSK